MSYIKLKITKRQLEAIVNITSSISSMIGTGTDFDEHDKEVDLIDRMLEKNGFKREFN